MSTVVYQRYLLNANGPNTSILASTTGTITANTAIVPLGAQWTIRLRGVAGTVVAADNSGALSVEAIEIVWQLFSPTGTLIYFWPINDSALTPATSLPKLANIAFRKWSDAFQTISSLDQIGNVVGGVNALVNAIVLNTDAANPHSASCQVNAILEFENAGASE